MAKHSRAWIGWARSGAGSWKAVAWSDDDLDCRWEVEAWLSRHPEKTDWETCVLPSNERPDQRKGKP